MRRRRLIAPVLLSLALLLPVAPSTTLSAASAPTAAPSSADVILNWEATALRTVYAENAQPIPVGILYLGFTSVTMYDAVTEARHRHASQEAAAAVAAHDVLAEYFPSSAANLMADRDASLLGIPDGTAKERGMKIGAKAADRMIKDRANDGRGDPKYVYERDEAPGVWQPTTMPFLAPWLGFVDPLETKRRVHLDGPDPIWSAAYAFDFQEVKRVGIAGTTPHRTDEQTLIATFFNSNSPIMYGDALIAALGDAPMSLRKTSLLFARMHAAMTDTIIQCWWHKFREGLWRPFQAIQGADDDHNPATVADPTWAPLIPNPAYPDYTSGHACVTSSAMEVIRQTLGETTELTLHSANSLTDRTYSTISELEFDAFHARIWGGLHFRDAMEDGYYLGHKTARRVMHELR